LFFKKLFNWYAHHLFHAKQDTSISIIFHKKAAEMTLLNTVTTETVVCCHLFVMEEQLWKLWTFSMTLMERVPLASSIPFLQ
jgi:hypothetical protein